jgi:hypothetical protein
MSFTYAKDTAEVIPLPVPVGVCVVVGTSDGDVGDVPPHAVKAMAVPQSNRPSTRVDR